MNGATDLVAILAIALGAAGSLALTQALSDRVQVGPAIAGAAPSQLEVRLLRPRLEAPDAPVIVLEVAPEMTIRHVPYVPGQLVAVLPPDLRERPAPTVRFRIRSLDGRTLRGPTPYAYLRNGAEWQPDPSGNKRKRRDKRWPFPN